MKFIFESQWDLITELSESWGSRLLEATNKIFSLGPVERSSDPHKRLSHTCLQCPVVSSRGVGWQWPYVGSGALNKIFLTLSPLQGGPLYPYHSLTSGQTIEREHIPAHQQKTELKIYWTWPRPSEQDPDSQQPVPPIRKFPQVSYPYPSEDRQNGNHNYRKLSRLITWITTLFNSVKLWAIPCRATQDGCIMVESSDEMWSTGEGKGKPLLALRIPWTLWKGKKIWHWKMNSPNQ